MLERSLFSEKSRHAKHARHPVLCSPMRPPQGKGCGPPGPNPFPHRSLMHRRNASPHRFLVRRSKPLQSAFPFPQEEHKTLTIPPARETQNCARNAELRKKRGTACSEILNLSTGTGQRSVPCSNKTVLSTGTSKNRCGRLEACGKPEGRL